MTRTSSPAPGATGPDPFSGVVTARDVYSELVRVRSDVQRIADGMEAQKRRADEREQAHKHVHADHEDRLRRLERWRWGTGAALTGVMLLAANSPLSSLIP